MLFKDIEKLVKLLENSDLDELEWEKNKERVRLKKSANGPVSSVMAYPAASSASIASGLAAAAVPSSSPAAVSAPASAPAASESGAKKSKGDEVKSPFVGTYYESPAPGAAKYVQVGQSVSKGDVLCIIEAMKIMNEIEAEVSGKISSILVKDGQAVQFGQPLFLIES